MNIGIRNVNGLNQECKLDMLLKEISRLKVDILGVAETHWTDEIPDNFEQGEYVIIHARNERNIRRRGGGIFIAKEVAKSMTTYEQILERLISASFLKSSALKLSTSSKICT